MKEVTLKAEKAETVFLLYFFIQSGERRLENGRIFVFDVRSAPRNRSGYTGELDENKRPVYSADLAQTTAQENIRRKGNRRAANQ